MRVFVLETAHNILPPEWIKVGTSEHLGRVSRSHQSWFITEIIWKNIWMIEMLLPLPIITPSALNTSSTPPLLTRTLCRFLTSLMWVMLSSTCCSSLTHTLMVLGKQWESCSLVSPGPLTSPSFFCWGRSYVRIFTLFWVADYLQEFRSSTHTSIHHVDVVSSCRYLRYLNDRLDWSTNTEYKKWMSRLYFLRTFRSFNICGKMLDNNCHLCDGGGRYNITIIGATWCHHIDLLMPP